MPEGSTRSGSVTAPPIVTVPASTATSPPSPRPEVLPETLPPSRRSSVVAVSRMAPASPPLPEIVPAAIADGNENPWSTNTPVTLTAPASICSSPPGPAPNVPLKIWPPSLSAIVSAATRMTLPAPVLPASAVARTALARESFPAAKPPSITSEPALIATRPPAPAPDVLPVIWPPPVSAICPAVIAMAPASPPPRVLAAICPPLSTSIRSALIWTPPASPTLPGSAVASTALGKKNVPSTKRPLTTSDPASTVTDPPSPWPKVPAKIWPPPVSVIAVASTAMVPAAPVLPGRAIARIPLGMEFTPAGKPPSMVMGSAETVTAPPAPAPSVLAVIRAPPVSAMLSVASTLIEPALPVL